MKQYISKIVKASFEQAIERITISLNQEGFEIIAELDMKNKLKNELHVDFRKYKILSVYNPSFAYEALSKEDKIGNILPCQVIVQEIIPGRIEVATFDLQALMEIFHDEKLHEIAIHIRNKLEKAIKNIY